MGITLNIPMPINCVDCDNRAIRPLIGCKLIFQGCANCGRHPNCPIVEAIPKADYKKRLKADMVAMLTDIQMEIEEIKPLEPTDDEDWQYGCFHGLELMQDKCLKLIQQKINSLEEA